MILSEEDVRLCSKKLFKHELFLAENLHDRAFVSARKVKNSDLASMSRHVVNDFARHRLAKREVVRFRTICFHDLHKSLDCERVVLAGDGKLRSSHCLAGVLLLNATGVVKDLTRRRKKLLTFVRHCHTSA